MAGAWQGAWVDGRLICCIASLLGNCWVKAGRPASSWLLSLTGKPATIFVLSGVWALAQSFLFPGSGSFCGTVVQNGSVSDWLLELSDCLAGLSLAAAWLPAWPVDQHASQVAARWLATKKTWCRGGAAVQLPGRPAGRPKDQLTAGWLAKVEEEGDKSTHSTHFLEGPQRNENKVRNARTGATASLLRDSLRCICEYARARDHFPLWDLSLTPIPIQPGCGVGLGAWRMGPWGHWGRYKNAQ
jgi:hypothetical protein